MIEVKFDEGVFKPGDYIYVPGFDQDRMKPLKLKVMAVQLTMDINKKTRLDYIGESGQVIKGELFDDYFICQKVIDIMDKHKKMVDQEIETVKAEQKKKEEGNGGRK